MFVFSCVSLDAVLLFSSGIGKMSIFSAPFSKQFEQRVDALAVVGHFTEDMPQLMVGAVRFVAWKRFLAYLGQGSPRSFVLRARLLNFVFLVILYYSILKLIYNTIWMYTW